MIEGGIERQREEIECVGNTAYRPVCGAADLTGLDNENIFRLIQHLVGVFQITDDFLKAIDPTTEYIVDIPAWVREGLGSGEYWFNRRAKTGKAMAQVMRKNDEGKNIAVAFLDLKEGVSVSAAAAARRELVGDIQGILDRRREAEAYNRLLEVKEVVELLEGGAMDDRLAEVGGALRSLKQASLMEDESNRKRLVNEAIACLNGATDKIERAIIRRIDAMGHIPQDKWEIKLRILLDPEMRSKFDQRHDEIGAYFLYLRRAYELIAVSHHMIREDVAAAASLEGLASFLARPEVGRLSQMQALHPTIDLSSEWYADPESLLAEERLAIEAMSSGELPESRVTMTGQMLLEAIANDCPKKRIR